MENSGKSNLKRQIDFSKEQIQYNYQREKYIRYGDYIVLRGSEMPYKYLSSRSILEENVFFLQQHIKLEIDGYSIIDYPNFSELIFTIYPNHYYEASKAYDKFQLNQINNHQKSSGYNFLQDGEFNQERINLENMSGKDISKFDTLRRRMEAEIEINNKRVNQFKGQYVTIGQEIMLYHVYSNSFIKATREKSDDENQSLFHIKLTQTPSSSTHFVIRINPYLNFKKDGEKIAYDELFYFENTKYHSVFSIQALLDSTRATAKSAANLLQQEMVIPCKVPMLTLNPDQKISKKQMVEEETSVIDYKNQSELTYVPTLEQMNYFTKYRAGHRKVQKERIDTFQAIFIKKPTPVLSSLSNIQRNLNNGPNVKGNKKGQNSNSLSSQLLWGDYVRLKHILRSNKKVSSIHIESNVCGYLPKAFAVVKEESNLLDKESCCDIFQIIPETETELGEPIKFDSVDYGSSQIRLRHMLTGKYLILEDKSMILSNTIDDQIMEGRKFVVESRKKKKKTEKKPDQNYGDSNLRLDTKESTQYGGGGKEDLQDYVDDFIEKTKFIIQNAGRDEPYLFTTTTFQLKSCDDDDNEKYVKISEQDITSQEFILYKYEKEMNKPQQKKKSSKNKNTYQSLPEDLCNEDYFKSWFVQMDSLKRKYYPTSSDPNEGDFFYFELVNEQIIFDYNTINCLLDPIIQLCTDTPSVLLQNNIVLAAQQNITILGLWLCDIKLDNLSEKPKLDQINALPVSRKQVAFRDLGVIDMLIKIVLHTFRNEYLCMDLIQNNVEIYQLIQTAIDFLIKVSYKNYANSIYIIQWYSLFKKIILDSEVVMEFKFDRLVNQLFQETNINVSFQDDLRLIANEIVYEEINLNALNLLLSFCQYNPFRKKHEHEEITQFLLENDQTRHNIFRSFKLNENGMAYLELEQKGDEKLKTVIDKDFQFVSKDLYLYSMQVVNLTAELCKGGPSLIFDHIKKYYDFKVCLAIIGNDDITAAYRAIFLNLFKESYLVNDFKYTLIEDLPSYIKLKNSADFEDTMLHGMFTKFREKINFKYFYQQPDEEENNSLLGPVIQDQIKSVNLEKSHINLKFIIDKFLKNFTNLQFKEQHESKDMKYEVNELAASILSLSHFIILRGFYTESEIAQLEKTIYEIFQQAYIFRKIKVNYKGVLKNKKVGGLLVTKNIHIPIEVVNWFSIAINILSFMEDLRLEELVQRLFQDHKFNKYFGEEEEKLIIINSDPLKQQQFIQEKRDRILDFFDMEQTQRNVKNIFVLCEMLLLDNIELKGKIVDIIYKQFSSKKRYLECLNNCITIDFNNERIYQTLNELYYIIHFGLIDIQFQKSAEINQSQTNLTKMSESFGDLISFLFDENPPDDLVELASLDLEDGDVQANPVKPSIETHQRVNGLFQFTKKKSSRNNGGSQNEILNSDNHIQLNQVNIELNMLNARDNLKPQEILETLVPSNLASNNRLDNEPNPTLNQINLSNNKENSRNSPNLNPMSSNAPLNLSLKKNMKPSHKDSNDLKENKKDGQMNEKYGFKGDSVMYSILDQHYIEIATLYPNQRLLKNMNYHKLLFQVLLTFGQKNLDKDQEYAKQRNNIVKNCIMALIYFTLQNEENQDLILQHPDYPEVIKSIFSLKNVDGMLELTFIFLSQIYKDNYSILLSLGSHFSKQGKFVLKSLFVNFFDQANKQDKSYCIYFMQFLKYFFLINSKSIQQNQTLIFKIFQDETISSKKQIQSIIVKSIKFCCTDFENPMNKKVNANPNANPHDVREEDFIIRVPQEAILIQQMLITFRELAKGSGLAVNTFVRIFFSLEEIRTLLRYASWNPSLKKEALDFLVEVYLNSKNIEPNEFGEIQAIIKETLYTDLIDYQRFIRQAGLNKNNLKWKCKSDSLNLFEGRNPYGSIRYLVSMNYLYGLEYYILNSVIPCLQSFFTKLPDIPSESQFQLASQIESLCKKLEKYWDNEDDHWKKVLEGENEGIMVQEDNIIGDDEESKDNKSDQGGLICDSDQQQMRNKSITRKMYSKKVSGTTLQKKQKKTDMIKGTQIVLTNILHTEKYRDIQMKQQNILTNYNYEAAFAVARQSRPIPLFQKSYIDQEHEIELDNLISTLIEIKIQDQSKFRTIIQSLIAVLSCDTIETSIRMNSMKILRKISNYKQDSKVNESIQHDLISMGFLNFLCDIIIIEQDPLMKLEYIRGLIDFMEESNRDIQDSFYQYVVNDKDNRFLMEVNSFLQSNYHSSRSNQGLFEDKGQHQQHFKRILILKFEICMRTLELLRLSTENHYRPMQDFLREQINANGEKKANNINMIHELADMFERYKKIIQDDDLQMGIKILDTLIEWIQGPCEENQLALCHTNLLENLEDMQYDISQRSKKRGEYQKYRSQFNQKTILILRSLFEGNFNPQITKKVSMYVDASLMIETISENYRQYQEYIRKISNVHQGLLYSMRSKNFKFEGEFDHTQYVSQETQISPLSADDLIQKYDTQSNLSNTMTTSFLERSATSNPANQSTTAKQLKNTAKENTEFYEKADTVISEAFERYMLIKNLKYLDPSFRKKYEESLDFLLNKMTNQYHDEVRKAMIFMEDNTCSIEIVNQRNQVQKVYFRNPPITQYLSTITKDRFQEKVNRDGTTEKITGLLSEEQIFLDEMNHFLKLNALGIYFNLTYLSWVRNLNLSIAFIINIFLLIDVFQVDDKAKTIASIFQYLNLGISGVVFTFWFVFEMPLEFKLVLTRYEDLLINTTQKERSVGKKRFQHYFKLVLYRVKTSIIKIVFFFKQIVMNSHLIYLLIYFFFSLGGIVWNNLFYSLLLLDIIERSQVLQNVIKAVTQNILQLIMTSVLGIVLVYIYAMIGYFTPTLKDSFKYYGAGSDDDHYNICSSATECFTTFLNMGLRAGGGIADYLYSPSQDDPGSEYISRFFFDLSFKIIVIIIMLNILFGIIIDTFGELRDARQFKEQDMRNRCFICNLERNEFENNRINFQKHISKQHNTWNYFFFLTHLRFKNINDFDGTESYVYEKYRKQDISWFPMGQSLKLYQVNHVDDEDEKNEIV